MTTRDLAIVGGGILGLAHAITAVRRGQTVVLFERSERARGASVRNFGMVWLIGQPSGTLLEHGLVSRRRWLEMAAEASFWCEESGALHLAHEDDELRVLEEFAAAEADGRRGELRVFAADEACRRWPGINPDGLRGALWSGADLRIDAGQAIAAMTDWLTAQPAVDVRLGTAVRRVQSGEVETTTGERLLADQVIICSGDDFQTLYPEVFVDSGLSRCKLQMMRTAPQPDSWRMGPTLAGALSLCHYDSFAACAGLPALRSRLASEFPAHLAHGIHVLVAQNGRGEVLIGDSHEYGNEFDPTERADIESLILAYMQRLVTLPDSQIAARWHGVYARRQDGRDPFIAKPEDGVTIVTAGGGAGMTVGFGLAERVLDGM